LGDAVIKAGLICEVSDVLNSVVATGVGVCRVPVPVRGDRGRGALVLRYNLSYRDVEELLVRRRS
jgi:hypothetical protein